MLHLAFELPTSSSYKLILNSTLLKTLVNSLPFKAFLFSFFYGILFYILQFFLFHTGVFNISINSNSLVCWDVSFYKSISETGYDHASHNTGFFILFPLIWKFSHLGVWGMCALNIACFAAGFGLLMQILNEKEKHIWLLLLTLPPVFYAFVPLTEAMFFLLATISMWAIIKKKFWLIWTTLFLMSIIRASTVFILPALLAAEVLTHHKNHFFKSIVAFLYKYCVPSLTGLAIFIYWQYYVTGIWFAYFKKQAENWGKAFSLPELPLSNIEGGDWRYHWLSAISMFIALLAVLLLLKKFILWLKGEIQTDANLIYAAGFLCMVLIFIIFFNPKYGGNRTFVMGANRYILITPFCFYFIVYLSRLEISYKQSLIVFIGANLFWALFKGFFDFHSFFIIGLIPTLLITAFLFYTRNKQRDSWSIMAIVAFNFLIQMVFFQEWLSPIFMD